MSGKVSIIVPLLNEAESLHLLYERIMGAVNFEYEIIFVDDGSTDESAAIIKEIINGDGNVHLISFRKNMGKAAALQAGFRNCTGDIVITMDADLQDEPCEIPAFIEKLNEGYDVVSGWKYQRNDPAEKRLPSLFFNGVTALMSGVQLHDFNCGFKGYKRVVVESINLYGELHRFIPVLADQKGFRITEIKVKHNKREFGKSKYGFERYLRGFFDALTVAFLSRYYNKPMHLFGRLGLFFIVVGFIICLYLSILWFMGNSIGSRPLLMLGVLSIMVGVQLFSIGLIGDIIVANNAKANYDESHIKEKI